MQNNPRGSVRIPLSVGSSLPGIPATWHLNL